MKRFLGFSLLSVVFCLALISYNSADAQAVASTWGVSNEYVIEADGSTSVKHILSATNVETDPKVKKIKIPTNGSDVTALKASAQDGQKLKSELSEDRSMITVTVDKDFSGIGRKWSVVISYRANLVDELGATQVAQIDPVTPDSLRISSHTVSISADIGLGFAVVRGPQPDDTQVAVGRQILSYANNKGKLSDTITLLFGESSVVQAQYETELSNDSWWWQTKTITLPPDTNQQRVFIESIEPAPTNVRLDEDGNILAEYSLSPKRVINVRVLAKLEIKSVTYTLESQQTVDEIDPVLRDRYTGVTQFWGSSDVAIDGNGKTAIEVIRAVYDAISKEVGSDVSPNVDSGSREGSLATVDALVSALRSKGVPARAVLGKTITDGSRILDSAATHAWAEALVPGAGWITLDPLIGSRSDIFGTSDVMHIALGLWGIQDDMPELNLDIWQLSYLTEDFPESTLVPELSAKKYVIFPGVSLYQMKAILPAGMIVDGAVFSADGQVYQLGSLGPFQAARARALRLGLAAFSSESVSYGFLNEDGSLAESLADASSSVDYSYFIGLVSSLVLIVAVIFIVKRQRKRKEKKRSKDSFILSEENEGGAVEGENLVSDEVVEAEPEPLPQIETEHELEPETEPESEVVEQPVEEVIVNQSQPTPPTEQRDPPKTGGDHKPPLIQG